MHVLAGIRWPGLAIPFAIPRSCRSSPCSPAILCAQRTLRLSVACAVRTVALKFTRGLFHQDIFCVLRAFVATKEIMWKSGQACER